MAQSILKNPYVITFDTDFFTKKRLHPESIIDHGMCGDIVLASPQETPYIKFIVKKFCSGYSAICMKYFRAGTLDCYVGEMDLDMSEQCIVQVACALRYMHQNNLVHLDVKLDNIFLDEDNNAILGDFGLAAQMKPGQQTLPKKNIGGTSGYFAPEYIAATSDTQLDPYKITE